MVLCQHYLLKHKNKYTQCTLQVPSPLFLERALIDETQILTEINTEQFYFKGVACLNDVEFWVCGHESMRLYNLKAVLVKSIKTRSGNASLDIAVTGIEDLVYTDKHDNTVNIVMDTYTQSVVRLQGWIPLGVCSTFSGDLLVAMENGDYSKVFRYSCCGSSEIQSIRYDDNGQPLYSVGNIKYITENRNLDICVSDNRARAVVAVNRVGKLRFTYSASPFTTKGTFDPFGITTDSLCRILTADSTNDCIHLLDKDGQFLRFINNCHLDRQMGLCVDTTSDLFVVEHVTGKLKTVQYLI